MFSYICKKCGKNFENRKKNKKFCSNDCYHKAKITKIDKPCEWCSATFFGFEKQKYCSISCSSCACSAEYTKRGKDRWTEFVCDNCSAIFSKLKSRKGKSFNFCGESCLIEYKKNNKYKIINCLSCNKEKKIPASRNDKFCNKKCAKGGKFHHYYGKKGFSGPKNPWTKGKTAETDEALRALGRKISLTLKQKFRDGLMSCKGEKNSNFGRTPDTRTAEQLENYSKAAVKRIRDGAAGYVSCHSGYYNTKKCEKDIIFYRSSLEKRALDIFENDDNIIKYYHEPISLKIQDGKRYIPDFVIETKNFKKYMIEIKGWIYDPDIYESKVNCAIDYCQKNDMIYEVWFKDDIEKKEYEIKNRRPKF